MLALLLAKEPVPQQAVEKLREVDDLPDLIFRNGLIERRKAFRCILIVGLADRLCLADGNFENVIATGHASDDQLVIRDEHGVGVVIASVKPLLNIAFNRIHANNIGRKITLPWVILKKLFKSAPKKSAELRVVTGLLFVIFRLMKIIII